MNRPIFIVGANRSGTTLLRLILNAHSEIAVPDELAYFRGHKFYRAPTHWTVSPLTPKDYPAFVHGFLDRNRVALSPLKVDQLIRDILAVGLVDMRTPYELTLNAWAKAHGKSRWGEKTPGNIFFSAEIRDMFPAAQFIYMVRDPRAGVLSMQKASIYSTDAAINAMNRRHFMTYGFGVLQQAVPPADLMVLRYEDLVTNAEEVVQKLCAFLGVAFESGMLDFYRNAEQYMKPEASEDINAAATRPIQHDKANAWRATMSSRDLAIVEYVCRDVMLQHGYELDGTSLGIVDRGIVAVKDAYWRYQMWKHRRVPGYQVMHGFLPRFRSAAKAGKSIGQE